MKHSTAFASELTWPDYAAAVQGGQTPILIPIGSMEQHGHHMPLHVDVLLPTEFARRVALEIGALVAPPFTYGYKSHQKSGGGNHLPGTTSLDGATLVAALKDVVKEFARHGVRRICLVNGHFENSWFIVEGIDLALRELRWDGITDLKVVVLSYWDFVHKEASVPG
jgi:creatinine amidohydrolase